MTTRAQTKTAVTKSPTAAVRMPTPLAKPSARAVQTELTSQLPYWMRWLPMTWLRDLSFLIHEANPKPSAMSLGPLGAKHGILLRKDGAPLSEGAMYHYRMALRHLGIVEVRDGLYHVDASKPDVAVLIKNARRGEGLSPAERDALASLIVANADCRRIFLRLFMKGDAFGLSDLRTAGTACHVYYPDEGGEVVVENPTHRRRVRYQSPTAQNASIWGVRTWCLQLDVLDELYLPPGNGPVEHRHLIFPIDPNRYDDGIIRRSLLDALPSGTGAQTVDLLDLLARICPKERLSARAVKSYLARTSVKHANHVQLVPATASERPTGDGGKDGVDRLHHKGWLFASGVWHRRVTFQPPFFKVRASS